jgi:hypothetical protein
MKWAGLTLAAALGAWTAADAHHSLYGVYDSARQVTVEATVTEFHFVSPHPYVMAEVAGGDRKAQRWRLEMDNRWELADIGVTSSTLQRGDRIVVTGAVGRSEPTHLYIRRLERPSDGFTYEQVGSRPRLGKRS